MRRCSGASPEAWPPRCRRARTSRRAFTRGRPSPWMRCVLAITSQRKLDARTPGAATPAAKRSLIVDFRVEDVDRERARLGPIVRRFVLEPTDQPWGNRAMLFRDPDGNLVNVFHPIRR